MSDFGLAVPETATQIERFQAHRSRWMADSKASSLGAKTVDKFPPSFPEKLRGRPCTRPRAWLRGRTVATSAVPASTNAARDAIIMRVKAFVSSKPIPMKSHTSSQSSSMRSYLTSTSDHRPNVRSGNSVCAFADESLNVGRTCCAAHKSTSRQAGRVGGTRFVGRLGCQCRTMRSLSVDVRRQ